MTSGTTNAGGATTTTNVSGPRDVKPLSYERAGGGVDDGGARYVARVCAAAMFAAAVTRLASFAGHLVVWLENGLSLYTAHWANAALLYKEFAGAAIAMFMLVAAIASWRGRAARRSRSLALWAAAAWFAVEAADLAGVVSVHYRAGVLDRGWKPLGQLALSLTTDDALQLLLPAVVWLLAQRLPRRSAP